MTYRVTCTVEAKATADVMAPERRDLLERGPAKLTLDPYHKATVPVGTHGTTAGSRWRRDSSSSTSSRTGCSSSW